MTDLDQEEFGKFVDLISKIDTLNCRHIALQLAKRYPHIFLEVTTQDRTNVFAIMQKPAWMTNARALLDNWHTSRSISENSSNKVDAIKLIREHTGLGLKEAKEIAELAINYMHPADTAMVQVSASTLTAQQVQCASQLAA